MPYCTASVVRLIVETSLSDSEIEVLFSTLSSGFGLVTVSGQVRVDFPAARITACIVRSCLKGL